MHKKNIMSALRPFSEGFILTEFIIAFAVLSFFILMCAYMFLTTIHAYSYAKERLYIYTLAQNKIESSWIESIDEGMAHDDRIKKEVLPFEQGILLPNKPKLLQEWLKINLSQKNKAVCARVRGRIKDE